MKQIIFEEIEPLCFLIYENKNFDGYEEKIRICRSQKLSIIRWNFNVIKRKQVHDIRSLLSKCLYFRENGKYPEVMVSPFSNSEIDGDKDIFIYDYYLQKDINDIKTRSLRKRISSLLNDPEYDQILGLTALEKTSTI